MGSGQVVVCSFDPGVTTGWAWHAVDREVVLAEGTRRSLMAAEARLGEFGARDGFDEHDIVVEMKEMVRSCWKWAKVDGTTDTFIVMLEDFVLRRLQMDRALLAPVRLNFAFEHVMLGTGIRVLYQSPSDAKNVVSDARLKNWNVYEPGSVHARDAQRHGVLFLRRYASSPALRAHCGVGKAVVG